MKGKNNSKEKKKPHHPGQALLTWYYGNKRNLPWRQTTDPYKIWLSEVILQQTRVDQGLPYYERFVEKYPDVKSLASARMEEVAKLWQGLGYYTRAQNLHGAAKQVCKELKGKFPTCYAELKKLKGVGDYTASAVASISSGEMVPAIDGNAFRVFSRLFEITEPIDKPATREIFRELAIELMTGLPSGDFNQAVMELGALVCRPKNPDCPSCPLRDYCPSRSGAWENLPVKGVKKKPLEMGLHYLLFFSGTRVLMQRRGRSGLWKNLCDFPSLNHAPIGFKEAPSEELNEKITEIWGPNAAMAQFGKPESLEIKLTHLLTHRKISAEFWRLHVHGKHVTTADKSFFWIPADQVSEQALPKLLEKFLDKIPSLT